MFEEEKKTIIVPAAHSEEDVLKQVKEEHSQGYNAVVSKRKVMAKDLKSYYVPATKKDKVNEHTIYTTMQTYMSVNYTDRAVVEFEERTAANAPFAQNLNRLREFDYVEMEDDKTNFQWIWDAGFHWVGIKLTDWWDDITKTPISRVMSPLSWIPDPQGGVSIDSHRWCGFEAEITKAELNRKGAYVNVELVNSMPWTEQEAIRNAYQDGRDLFDFWVDWKENEKYSIYHHYTRIDWVPYIITTANEHTLIIRMRELKAAFEDEKKDPTRIGFPVALKYVSPLKGDPFGISYPDLLRDKQTANSKLINLTLVSATRNALWDDKLYNPKKIKNVKDLQTPTIGGKYIAANVNEGENLSNALMTVQKENPTKLPFSIEEKLFSLTSLSTGINANTMWIGWMQNMTAAESQSIQKNANLRFVLNSRVGLWWEKDAVRQWIRSYVLHLSASAKKTFKVTSVFGSSYFELGRKDFISSENLVINVRSKSEIEEERNKYKNDLYWLAPQFLADPEVPTVGKLKLKRKMADFGLLSDEEIAELTLNVDEENAKLDVELMNAWEEPVKLEDNQDHLIYISVYHSADDTPQKWEAISARKQAYLESAKRAAEQQGQLMAAAGQWGGNTQQNIASSNAASRQGAAIQQEATQTASLADV